MLQIRVVIVLAFIFNGFCKLEDILEVKLLPFDCLLRSLVFLNELSNGDHSEAGEASIWAMSTASCLLWRHLSSHAKLGLKSVHLLLYRIAEVLVIDEDLVVV